MALYLGDKRMTILSTDLGKIEHLIVPPRSLTVAEVNNTTIADLQKTLVMQLSGGKDN